MSAVATKTLLEVRGLEVEYGRVRAVDGIELTIGEGDHAELTLRLTKSLTPAPLADRPHSWDY